MICKLYCVLSIIFFCVVEKLFDASKSISSLSNQTKKNERAVSFLN